MTMATTESNFSEGFSTGGAFSTATATSSSVERKPITPRLIVLCTFLFAVVTISTVANLFVLLAYKFEKSVIIVS